MSNKNLVSKWISPDGSQLTPRQISLRLPIEVASKIDALCEIFPRKSKTELIGDLLSSAIMEVENSIPETWKEIGEVVNKSHEGPKSTYDYLADKYFQEYAREIESRQK